MYFQQVNLYRLSCFLKHQLYNRKCFGEMVKSFNKEKKGPIEFITNDTV